MARRNVTSAFLWEVGIVAVLYALWQLAGRLSLLSIEPAIARGVTLWNFERTLRLPNEATIQNWLVPHSLSTQAANLYYAGVHVPAMGVFLVWLFLRYRDRYPLWRNTLAFTTAACLVIQLFPVAPPRLTEETMMIDTGLAYGQSVYGVLGRGIAGQLQAMPSIHVGWAALVGWATWRESTSRWRWVGPAHFAVTFIVVAVTGNHYWLDGIVAMALLWVSWHVARWIRARLDRKMLATAAVGVIATSCASTVSPAVPEQAVPDTTISEQAVPDTTTPEQAVPDTTISEQPSTTTSTTTPTTTTKQVVSVRIGSEVAAASGFEEWSGSRVGVIAHPASVTADGTHVADLLDLSKHVELVALFAPEHGMRGQFGAGELVNDTLDTRTNAPIFSLYSNTRSPTPEMLDGIDVLFYDLQDVGTRYYTYISTMGLAMQAAAANDVSFVVLDRPNPLGDRVEGDVLDPTNRSFVGQYEIPSIYGLTAGELAEAIVGERLIDGVESLDLHVVRLEGWDRSGWPQDRPWVQPSPAITSADTALLYPTTVVFEATTLNYGRGTEMPFEVIGAPWLDGDAIAGVMNALALDGVDFDAVTYTPIETPGSVVAHAEQELRGVQLTVTDSETLRPTEVGVRLLATVVAHGEANGVSIDSIVDRPDWLAKLSGSRVLYEWIRSPSTTRDPVANQADANDIRSALAGYRHE